MKSFINILNEYELIDLFEIKDEFENYLKEKYKIPNITFSKHYDTRKNEYFIKIHFYLKKNIDNEPNFTLEFQNLLYNTQMVNRLKYLDRDIRKMLVEYV